MFFGVIRPCWDLEGGGHAFNVHGHNVLLRHGQRAVQQRALAQLGGVEARGRSGRPHRPAARPRPGQCDRLEERCEAGGDAGRGAERPALLAGRSWCPTGATACASSRCLCPSSKTPRLREQLYVLICPFRTLTCEVNDDVFQFVTELAQMMLYSGASAGSCASPLIKSLAFIAIICVGACNHQQCLRSIRGNQLVVQGYSCILRSCLEIKLR